MVCRIKINDCSKRVVCVFVVFVDSHHYFIRESQHELINSDVDVIDVYHLALKIVLFPLNQSFNIQFMFWVISVGIWYVFLNIYLILFRHVLFFFNVLCVLIIYFI